MPCDGGLPAFFCSLLEHGYTLLHVRDELVGRELLGPDYLGSLPVMEEVLPENLQYDLDDARKVTPAALPSFWLSILKKVKLCWHPPIELSEECWMISVPCIAHTCTELQN